MSRRAPAGGAFSWEQFRILLFAIRKGEERMDDNGMGTSLDVGSKLGVGARRVVMALALLAMAALFWVMGMGLGELGVSVRAAFDLCVLSTVLATVILGLYQAVTTLYFVRDLGYYLTLPLSSTSVMWAKLAHFLAGSAASDLLFLAMGFGCLFVRGEGVLTYVAMALAFVPCAVAINLALTIVCVLLMRFSRLARNRDRFSRAFGGLIMVLALGIGVGSQLLVRVDGSSALGAVSAVGDFSSSLAGTLLVGVLCPPWLAAGLVFDGGVAAAVAGLALMVALTGVYAVILNACAARWYFEGVRALQGAGQKTGRRLGAAALRRATGVRGAFAANVARDWASLVRTPAFFNQCVLGLVLMPLYMVAIVAASTVAGLGGTGLDLGWLLQLVRGLASGLTFQSEGLVACAAAVFGFSVFMGLGAYPFTLAVSRDGEDFAFMKALPMDWSSYLAAKLVPTFALAAAPLFVLLAAACVVLWVPPAVSAVLLAEYLLSTLAVSALSLGFGARFPHLHWDNEAQLFKGGKATLRVFAGLLLSAVVLALPALLTTAPLFAPGTVAPALALLGGLALLALECAALVWWTLVPTARSLGRLEA